MGAFMSGTPNWAMTQPSTYSTMEWMMLWGCMTTEILSTGTSNSHLASMTSSPLFIMVAESMVIFFPMLQLGWLSASSMDTPASFASGYLKKGPPDAVRMMRFTSSQQCP